EEFGRRERQLVSLARRAGLPGAAAIEPLTRAPRAVELLVEVIRDARFERARPFVVGRDETRDGRLDEGRLLGVEEEIGCRLRLRTRWWHREIAAGRGNLAVLLCG